MTINEQMEDIKDKIRLKEDEIEKLEIEYEDLENSACHKCEGSGEMMFTALEFGGYCIGMCTECRGTGIQGD